MLYRLPTYDESFTEDPDLYGNEWEKFANKVLKFFPGFCWCGIGGAQDLWFEYRQCFKLGKRSSELLSKEEGDSVYRACYSFKLPFEACFALLEGKCPQNVYAEDLYSD